MAQLTVKLIRPLLFKEPKDSNLECPELVVEPMLVKSDNN